MLADESIAAKAKYAGNLYLQFELEDSWERPGTRAFGRVNGGLVFEAAYLFDKASVPMLSVFYADKSFLKGMSHLPIYRKCIFCIFYILRNCSRPIARTGCLSAHLGYLMALFSSGWITSGSANFYFCSKSIPRQTLACSTASAPMFLCWKSTRARENKVILCLFYIFFIF